MFKSILLPAILLIAGACGISRKDESKKVSTASGANAPVASIIDSADNVTPAEMEAFFIVADTGYNYLQLQKIMLRAAKRLQWPTDTLERTWIPGRDSILPVNPSPTFFGGGYYPRTSFEECFSIEYWDSLSEDEKPADNKMAIVAGVHTRRSAADAALHRIRMHCPKAFVEPGILLTHVIH